MARGPGSKGLELDDLLRTADIVSIHLRATPEPKHFLNLERLALLKPGVLLINTARGSLMDEAALVEFFRERESPVRAWTSSTPRRFLPVTRSRPFPTSCSPPMPPA